MDDADGRATARTPETATGPDPDWAQVQAHVDGDPDAFAQLVSKHGSTLEYFVIRRAGYRLGYLDPAEVANETWYRVLQLIHQGKASHQGRFLKWVMGTCLNVLKSRRFLGESLGTDGAKSPLLPETHVRAREADPAQAMAAAEFHTALQGCLEDLDDQLRSVYELHFEQDRSFTDIAREFGCSDTNVRVKLMGRMTARLGRCLHDKGFGETMFQDSGSDPQFGSTSRIG